MIISRIETMLREMTLEEKVGQLFSDRPAPLGDGSSANFDSNTRELVTKRFLGGLTTVPTASTATEVARWTQEVRRLTDETPSRVPVLISSNQCHGRPTSRLLGLGETGRGEMGRGETGLAETGFSLSCDPLGLAATHDDEIVTEFAAMTARELAACGVRVALEPMADVATEPRWARIGNTFGEDRHQVARMVTNYLTGIRRTTQPGPVGCVVKHFPGHGPQRDGEDAHFPYGTDAVYPGERFDDHLAPFAAAIAAGVDCVMMCYSIPRRTEYPEVGFAFSRAVVTGLLRERLGFDGVIWTDFNIVTPPSGMPAGIDLPARGWGVEELDVTQRLIRLLDAGVDVFGGESDPRPLVDAVRAGLVSEARIEESTRRMLRLKEKLGLFTDTTPDPIQLSQYVGTERNREIARRAERASLVALTGKPFTEKPSTGNATGRDKKIFAVGFADNLVARFGTPTADLADADVAIVKTAAPYEQRPSFLERAYHAGGLEFAPDELAELLRICRTKPTAVAITLDRPAAIPELASEATALIADFGASDEVVLDAIFSRSPVSGRLPFDLPRSTAAVAASRTDVPFDTADPVFRCGHGLRWTTS